jgi:hypothetical protein
VGKRNREKRAAKQRARRQRGPTPPRDFFDDRCTCGEHHDHGGYADDLPSPVDMLAQALLEAAHVPEEAQEQVARDCAAALSHGDRSFEPAILSAAADLALRQVIGMLWPTGWLPVDLWQVIRRRLHDPAPSLLTDALAAEIAQYAPPTVHERWTAQLAELDATLWWDQSRPHLGQWTQRYGADLEAGLYTVVTLLAELMTLPKLPRILPPPGTATRHDKAATGVDQKILSRVRGLLAKAESTEFPDEAEALSAKAQELMNRHAFERALVDATEHTPQQATSCRIWLESPYVDAKAHLVDAVARANRCRSVQYAKLGFVALVGEQLDLDITELLVTSLLIQATRAMVSEGRHTTRTGVSRTRSFRQSFLVSYAARIGERLTEAATAAHDPAEDARLLPVLADRSRVVEETFDAMFDNLVERRTSVNNGAGWTAGRKAADRADLDIERTAVRS